MTRVVVDASVVVKWLMPFRAEETDTEQALELLDGIKTLRVGVLQPPHWLAEAAGVTARLDPDGAVEAVGLLFSLELPTVGGLEVYERACRLAVTMGEHLFDTLYHSVALIHPDTVLVTADERYYRKGAGLGRIVRLREFELERT